MDTTIRETLTVQLPRSHPAAVPILAPRLLLEPLRVEDADEMALVLNVRATVTSDDDRVIAMLAWTIGTRHQRRGYGTEAGRAMAAWLRDRGVTVLVADIHPDHAASSSVARALGLAPTDLLVGGEIRWTGVDQPFILTGK